MHTTKVSDQIHDGVDWSLMLLNFANHREHHFEHTVLDIVLSFPYDFNITGFNPLQIEKRVFQTGSIKFHKLIIKSCDNIFSQETFYYFEPINIKIIKVSELSDSWWFAVSYFKVYFFLKYYRHKLQPVSILIYLILWRADFAVFVLALFYLQLDVFVFPGGCGISFQRNLIDIIKTEQSIKRLKNLE